MVSHASPTSSALGAGSGCCWADGATLVKLRSLLTNRQALLNDTAAVGKPQSAEAKVAVSPALSFLVPLRGLRHTLSLQLAFPGLDNAPRPGKLHDSTKK